jgi:hypothetical protein
MALPEEYDALKKTWRGSTPLVKAVHVISFVVSLGSLLSIAETVSKFSGFVVTAVKFYRTLTEPLARVLAMPQLTVDAMFYSWSSWVPRS